MTKLRNDEFRESKFKEEGRYNIFTPMFSNFVVEDDFEDFLLSTVAYEKLRELEEKEEEEGIVAHLGETA